MLSLSEERKFHLIFAHESKSSRERKFLGMRVPGNESTRERKFHVWNFLYGTFAPGSESTWERKFLLPYDTTIENYRYTLCEHAVQLLNWTGVGKMRLVHLGQRVYCV